MEESCTCSGEGARERRKSAPSENSHVEEYDDREDLEASSISARGVEVTSLRVAVGQRRETADDIVMACTIWSELLGKSGYALQVSQYAVQESSEDELESTRRPWAIANALRAGLDSHQKIVHDMFIIQKYRPTPSGGDDEYKPAWVAETSYPFVTVHEEEIYSLQMIIEPDEDNSDNYTYYFQAENSNCVHQKAERHPFLKAEEIKTYYSRMQQNNS
ncbi:hypothetical protein BDR07DRAFT_1383341 [Suillus spraguei]|nr:hypothetical protein BDR07DRAFT_1383341 [Suillus spraguei]